MNQSDKTNEEINRYKKQWYEKLEEVVEMT